MRYRQEVSLGSTRKCRGERSCATWSQRGFTLVELLVVIAIIGVLIALLLPAVQSARESARRLTCKNQVRQVIVAMHNHLSTHNHFPTGGITPRPDIANYSSGARPFAAPRQGLSWAFQVLPYLEQGALHELGSMEAIKNSPVGLYNCPSRRGPTFCEPEQSWLMDYIAFQPAPTRAQLGDDQFESLILNEYVGCQEGYGFWGVPGHSNDYAPATASRLEASGQYVGFWGVIIRSSYFVSTSGRATATVDLGYGKPVRMAQITDGSSNTVVIGEKWVDTRYYEGKLPDPQNGDDRGWADGWDFDVIGTSVCPPTPDSAGYVLNGQRYDDESGRIGARSSGSAHPGGMNTAFADGSVHFLNFDIEVEVLNQLAHREDGAIVDLQAL